MYKKHCYKCHRSSFSSCNTDEWICPTCGTDLTNQKSFAAESQSNSLEERMQKKIYYTKIDKKSSFNERI